MGKTIKSVCLKIRKNKENFFPKSFKCDLHLTKINK